ncbi:hypothetical protein SPRG_22350 [Saprolegnia parasitica CBS 223.65]|uniref:Ataxin-10 domain-containing protein n=1 Tax=Saprolegnia parasitica (strain CBS 223.65) TaxID=695850 RepID=A0A067BYA9_SAPPC|nr:hypothetical protein SPRG_22350 [Saprolegnia parasitica CBS 223.65]KDO19296.1 hypothetical protein SPRG_22350 [Saprolegnia parasitica CBS 223.65]|eukprot:XP_012210007.1 hypothetical protein SPRG_22350 [Saprolegnia parasitica CBS 223.65]
MVQHLLQEQLHELRQAATEDQLVEALGLVSVLLVRPDERGTFGQLDGLTTLVNHLQQLCAEQAAMAAPWTYSKAFGFHIGQKRLHTSVRYLLLTITHMALDADLAAELCDLHLPQELYDEFVASECISETSVSSVVLDDGHSSLVALPQSCRLLALEALRNLCYTEALQAPHLTNGALDDLWRQLLEATSPATEVALIADVFCNLSAHVPRALHAEKDRLTALLARLVNEKNEQVLIALSDLAVNLARDNHFSVIFLCALEEGSAPGRPILYLRDWAEATTDLGLRSSLGALTHNLAWSDVSTKIALQKLGASAFLEVFV